MAGPRRLGPGRHIRSHRWFSDTVESEDTWSLSDGARILEG